MDSFDLTPKKILKGMQSSNPNNNNSSNHNLHFNLSPEPESRADPKAAIRGFINVKEENNPNYKELLSSPVFKGHYPKIVDQEFTLERYATENISPLNQNFKNDWTSTVQESLTEIYSNDSIEIKKPRKSSFFLNFLIFLNYLLFGGIIITMLIIFFQIKKLYLQDFVEFYSLNSPYIIAISDFIQNMQEKIVQTSVELNLQINTLISKF